HLAGRHFHEHRGTAGGIRPALSPQWKRPRCGLMWRFVLPLVIVGMLFAALWAGLFRNPGEVPSPHIGRPVPEFALPELHDPDNTFTHEALRGRISLLN